MASGSDGGSDGEGGSGGDASTDAPMCCVQFGCWNLNGLADYKQRELLRAARAAQLDVLALCETHGIDLADVNRSLLRALAQPPSWPLNARLRG